MGVTSLDLQLLEDLILAYDIKSVIELGAQNNFSGPGLPAPYMREWYEAQGISYSSIDLNGECKALKLDLAYPFNDNVNALNAILPHPIENFLIHKGDHYDIDAFDLVTDFGTSEHIGIDGKFAWKAIYNCWKTKHDLCKIGGLIISENPETNNWPTHGFQYYTQIFYLELQAKSGLNIMIVDEVCAMGNCKDGKNILCVMRKDSNNFPDLETFKTFDLRQS